MLKLYSSTFVMKKIKNISLSDREEKRRICCEQKQSDVKIGQIKVNIEKILHKWGSKQRVGYSVSLVKINNQQINISKKLEDKQL